MTAADVGKLGLDVTACRLGHTATSVGGATFVLEKTGTAENRIVCARCSTVDRTCLRRSCLCVQRGAVIDASSCPEHHAIVADVIVATGSAAKKFCTNCEHLCARCGCSEHSIVRCRAKCRGGRGSGTSSHTVGQPHSLRPSVRANSAQNFICQCCVIEPICKLCRATEKHVDFCEDHRKAEGKAVFAVDKKMQTKSLSCAACGQRKVRERQKKKETKKKESERLKKQAQKRDRGAAGLADDGVHDGEGGGGGGKTARTKVQMKWASLSLARWALVLHAHDDGGHDGQVDITTLYTLAAQFVIADTDAQLLGRRQAVDLVRDALAFMHRARQPSSDGSHADRRSRSDTVPAAVSEMLETLLGLVRGGGGARGGGVVLNTQALRAQTVSLKLLRSKRRFRELKLLGMHAMIPQS